MKKTILILLLASFTLLSYGQQKRKWKGNYLLTGVVENATSGEATLIYTDNTRQGSEIKVISGAIAEGKFGFSNYLEEPALATLKIGEKEYALYIDPCQMLVTVPSVGDELKVTGSWTNDDEIKIKQLEDKINELAGEDKKPHVNLAELSYASVEKNSFIVLKKMLEVANPKHPYHSDTRSKQMIGILMNMSSDLKDTPTGLKTSEILFISSMKMYQEEINKD